MCAVLITKSDVGQLATGTEGGNRSCEQVSIQIESSVKKTAPVWLEEMLMAKLMCEFKSFVIFLLFLLYYVVSDTSTGKITIE